MASDRQAGVFPGSLLLYSPYNCLGQVGYLKPTLPLTDGPKRALERCSSHQEDWGPANAHSSRASFALPVAPIGARRGAEPLCVYCIPQEWGAQGVDKATVAFRPHFVLN